MQVLFRRCGELLPVGYIRKFFSVQIKTRFILYAHSIICKRVLIFLKVSQPSVCSCWRNQNRHTKAVRNHAALRQLFFHANPFTHLIQPFRGSSCGESTVFFSGRAIIRHHIRFHNGRSNQKLPGTVDTFSPQDV